MDISKTTVLWQTFSTRRIKIFGLILLVLPLFYGCIYDTPKGDLFFRTLWTSEEFPYGFITLEFLCDNNVKIKGENAIGSYGHYKVVEYAAHFESLELKYEIKNTVSITIEEAHRIGDNMQITWHLTDSMSSSTTTMTRLKSYQ